MKKRSKKTFLLLLLLAAASARPVAAGETVAPSPESRVPGPGVSQSPVLSEVQDSRYRALIQELRCLVCQNQSIAESAAPLADDLRQQVRAQILDGKSDAQILAFLTARYGDFVLYRPRFKAATALLWLAPLLLVVLGAGVALRFALRRRAAPAAAVDAAALQRLLDESGKAPR